MHSLGIILGGHRDTAERQLRSLRGEVSKARALVLAAGLGAALTIATSCGSLSSGSSAQSTQSQSETPTSTPVPTLPPTPAPTPVPTLSFSGSGDGVEQLPSAYQTPPLLLTATCSCSGNFIVEPLSSTNAEQAVVINAIGRYSGTVPFDLSQGSTAASIKVQADGSWTLKLDDITTAQKFSSSVSGTGDDVLVYDGGPETVKITNTGSSNFVVKEYPQSGSENLLVNEIGAYSGVQPLQAGPSLIEINSDGNWSIAPS